jgi:hypothetical protein
MSHYLKLLRAIQTISIGYTILFLTLGILYLVDK